MIKLLNFIIKIIASLLVFLMFFINMVIVILFWEGKYEVSKGVMDMIWYPQMKKNNNK